MVRERRRSAGAADGCSHGKQDKEFPHRTPFGWKDELRRIEVWHLGRMYSRRTSRPTEPSRQAHEEGARREDRSCNRDDERCNREAVPSRARFRRFEREPDWINLDMVARDIEALERAEDEFV